MLDIVDPRTDPADVDQEAAARLKRARIEAGYRTAVEFARVLSMNITTYHHHENGRRGIPEAAALRYAKALRVPVTELLYGDQLRTDVTVPIVGMIAQGGRIITMTEMSQLLEQPAGTVEKGPETLGKIERVQFPDPKDLVCFVVHGNDFYPAYREGDKAFTKEPIRVYNGIVPTFLHGVECVVELENGERMLRQVMLQPDGRVTLIGYAQPPIFNVTICSAAPVEMIKRATPTHT